MKHFLLFCFSIGLLSSLSAQNQTLVDVSAGVQAFHIPLKGFSYNNPQPVVMAGVHQSLNRRQTLGLTLRIGYARHKYQGDALTLQALFQYTPVVANHLELGIGIGGGYRCWFHPSRSLQWTGSEWKNGRAYKGVIQVPLQLSMGYRGISTHQGEFRPYIAYQLGAHFGYTPDLTPMPTSTFLVGVKYAPKQH